MVGDSGTVAVVLGEGGDDGGMFVVVWVSVVVVCVVAGSPDSEVVGTGSASITVIRHPRLR